MRNVNSKAILVLTKSLVIACLVGFGPTCGQLTAQDSINGVEMKTLVANLRNKQFRHGRTNAMIDIARYGKRPGDHLAAYLEGLKDDDKVIRATAANSLGLISERFPSLTSEFLTQLGGALDDPQYLVVDATLNACAKIGDPARAIKDKIQAIYKSTNRPATRTGAMRALAAIASRATDQVEVVLELIQRDPAAFHIEWLDGISPLETSPNLTQAIVELFNTRNQAFLDSSNEIRPSLVGRHAAMIRYIRRFGPQIEKTKNGLLELLRQPVTYRIRKEVAQGEDSEGAAMLKAEPLDIEMRIWAAVAIVKISPASAPEAFAVLRTHLESKDPGNRLSALLAVGRISNSPAAKQIVPMVTQLESDPELSIRVIAKHTNLRIKTAPNGSNYKTQHVTLSAPELNDEIPSAKEVMEQLKSRIVELKKIVARQDFLTIINELMAPAELERFWIQNGHETFNAQRREEATKSISQLLESIDVDGLTIELKGKRAAVLFGSKRLTFVRFNGRWYLND